jgi:hypothetical protein
MSIKDQDERPIMNIRSQYGRNGGRVCELGWNGSDGHTWLEHFAAAVASLSMGRGRGRVGRGGIFEIVGCGVCSVECLNGRSLVVLEALIWWQVDSIPRRFV